MVKSRSFNVVGPSLWHSLLPASRTTILSSNLSTSLALLKTCTVCFLRATFDCNEKHFCKALCCEKRYINVRIQYNTINPLTTNLHCFPSHFNYMFTCG